MLIFEGPAQVKGPAIEALLHTVILKDEPGGFCAKKAHVKENQFIHSVDELGAEEGGNRSWVGEKCIGVG